MYTDMAAARAKFNHFHTQKNCILINSLCKAELCVIKDQPQRWLKEMWNRVYYTNIASN